MISNRLHVFKILPYFTPAKLQLAVNQNMYGRGQSGALFRKLQNAEILAPKPLDHAVLEQIRFVT